MNTCCLSSCWTRVCATTGISVLFKDPETCDLVGLGLELALSNCSTHGAHVVSSRRKDHEY